MRKDKEAKISLDFLIIFGIFVMFFIWLKPDIDSYLIKREEKIVLRDLKTIQKHYLISGSKHNPNKLFKGEVDKEKIKDLVVKNKLYGKEGVVTSLETAKEPFLLFDKEKLYYNLRISRNNGNYLIDDLNNIYYYKGKKLKTIKKPNISKNRIKALTPEIEDESAFRFFFDYGSEEAYVLGFKDDISLKSVEIPYCVINSSNKKPYLITKIGSTNINHKYVFANEEVENVFIPNTIKFIGEGAFKGNKIKELNLPTSVIEIGSYSFDNNKLEEVRLNNGIEKVGEYAFSNNKIESLLLPNNISKIEKGVFYNNNIKNIYIPENIKNIGAYAFSKNNIDELDLHKDISVIGDFAFSKNKIKQIEIPLSVEFLGQYAFANNLIEKFTTYSNIKNIPKGLFFNNKIETLTINNNIKNIGSFSFYKNKIKKVSISSDVEKIGAYAFIGNNIKEIDISKDTFVSNQAFDKYVKINKY